MVKDLGYKNLVLSKYFFEPITDQAFGSTALFQKISTYPHGRQWKSCRKCSVSLTGNPWISTKFCEFWLEFQENHSKSCQILEFLKIVKTAGFGILQKLLLFFLEILKFLGTQFSVVHRGVWIFSEIAHSVTFLVTVAELVSSLWSKANRDLQQFCVVSSIYSGRTRIWSVLKVSNGSGWSMKVLLWN